VSEPADWGRWFTAPTIAHLRVAAAAPHRLAAISNEDGTWQAWGLDLRAGTRMRASDLPVGVETAEILPDGTAVVWWADPTGDESGRWVCSPFDGGPAWSLLGDAGPAWQNGLAMTATGLAAGLVTEGEGYRVLVRIGDGRPREVYRAPVPAGQGDDHPALALSADAGLVAFRTSERGDIEITGIRVVDTATGGTLADLEDPGTLLAPIAWSPIEGDPRLLFVHEREGWERPGIWNGRDGRRTDLEPGLGGAVVPLGWFPDGASVLVRQEIEARSRLYRLDPVTGEAALLLEPDGSVGDAVVRPDGDVWANVGSSAAPSRWVDLAGREAVPPPGDPPPAGRPARPFHLVGPSGDRVQAFVLEPDGQRPHPTILSVHGGPNWHHADAFEPRSQAYVARGYAVLLVNYRGSTGYGTAFRDALRGNPGFPESEDVNAALDHAIAEGVADPQRLFIEGWSWGGYLATLNAGLRPERWRAVAAGIPVGDYVAAHYESAPELRAWDVAMFGGSPMEVPEAYLERNPMTYVDRVQAPVLLIAGERDSRCPLGQVMTYAHALRARGKDVEVHLYAGGHHANAMAERIAHVRRVMAFFDRYR
jgi:dipeptidyl aminopeptidase/acylaminoacyl peptidase